MNWWEEAEARAHRAKTPASMAQALFQRFQSAGFDPDMAHTPAYDLAHLYDLCADFIKLVDSALLTGDGDRPAMRRHAMTLSRWAELSEHWTRTTAPAFNQLMDSLEFEPETLASREEVAPPDAGEAPEIEPKLEGRYRHWHLLYERLDLKLASVAVEEPVRRALARSLSRIYEQCLITIRVLNGLEKEAHPRFRQTARLLLEINTSWHFDLGPHVLGHGAVRARPGVPGLQTWLLIGFTQ